MMFINVMLLAGLFCGGMGLVERGRKDSIDDINKYILYEQKVNYHYFYKDNRLR